VNGATSPRQVPENGPPAAPALRRTLSLWQVSVSGIGVILGAGVYALVGPAAGLAGNALWLAFLVVGVAAGLTAYSYARLGTIRPKDSPEFQYTALAFGPRIGFVAGWLMWPLTCSPWPRSRSASAATSRTSPGRRPWQTRSRSWQ
jgi:amino acid transporter